MGGDCTSSPLGPPPQALKLTDDQTKAEGAAAGRGSLPRRQVWSEAGSRWVPGSCPTNTTGPERGGDSGSIPLWAGGALAGAGVQQGDPRTAELGCEAGAQLSPLHAQGPLVGVRDPRDWAGPQESSQLPMASRVVCTQA